MAKYVQVNSLDDLANELESRKGYKVEANQNSNSKP